MRLKYLFLSLFAFMLWWLFWPATGARRQFAYPENVSKLKFDNGDDGFYVIGQNPPGLHHVDIFSGTQTPIKLPGYCRDMAMNEDRSILYLACDDGWVYEYQGNELRKLFSVGESAVAVTAKGNYVVAAESERHTYKFPAPKKESYDIVVWRVNREEMESRFGSSTRVGKVIITCGETSLICIEEDRGGAPGSHKLIDSFWCLRLADGEVLWDRREYTPLERKAKGIKKLLIGYPFAADISPSGDILYVGGAMSLVALDASNAEVIWGRNVFQYDIAKYRGVQALCCSPDGRRLFVGQENGRVAVADAQDGTLLHEFEVLQNWGAVRALDVSSNGRRLLAGGRGSSIGWRQPLPGQKGADPFIRIYNLPRECW